GTYEIARRDTLEKETVKMDEVVNKIEFLLDDMQQSIYAKALQYGKDHITEVNSYDEFKAVLEGKGGFISAHWDGTAETEERIKEETKATIRCIPIDVKHEMGSCMVTGKQSPYRVLFAKAY
ncbi:MAG: proline--tRNA ligase, partial [Bacteroidota bacterium]